MLETFQHELTYLREGEYIPQEGERGWRLECFLNSQDFQPKTLNLFEFKTTTHTETAQTVLYMQSHFVDTQKVSELNTILKSLQLPPKPEYWALGINKRKKLVPTWQRFRLHRTIDSLNARLVI